MRHVDLILLHPPITYRFRELSILHGPSNVAVPSSPIFENYPIGFLTLSEYLDRQGISVSVVNLAVKMLLNRAFDPDAFIARLKPVAFGIDLHWLPHVDGSLTTAEMVKRHHPDIPSRSWQSFPAGGASMTVPPAAVPGHPSAGSAGGPSRPSGRRSFSPRISAAPPATAGRRSW